jgi:transposase
VLYARQHGVKPAARVFECSPNTVRKWLRRFDNRWDSLADRSRAPVRRPRKLSPEAEARILKAKQSLPLWSARRLKRDCALPYSEKAIRRVFRDHHLTRNYRRKKPQTKRCLRELKKRWPLWQQIDVDVKYLDDLPEYWIQAQARRLPKFQYTAREVSTGVLFLGYADELAQTYAELFVRRILQHLQLHGAKLRKITVQTDNGVEFVGPWHSPRDSHFSTTVESFRATHRTIPPGAYRFQADVETVHALMESEFFLESFRDRSDFLAKAQTYQHFFNYVRPNSGKEHLCPFDLIRQKDLTARLHLLYLPPVFLEDLLHQDLVRTPRVHDVWVHPSAGK